MREEPTGGKSLESLVIDTNILFSFFKSDSTTRKIIYKLRGFLDLYTPEYAYDELQKYKEVIIKKAGISPEKFEEILGLLSHIIIPIPEDEYTDTIHEALKITPDLGDIDFIALAIKLNCPVWSNDKKLKQIKNVKVMNTSEIISLLSALEKSDQSPRT